MKKVIIAIGLALALTTSCRKQDSTCHKYLFEHYCIDANGSAGTSSFGDDEFCYDAGIVIGSPTQIGSGVGGVKCYKKYYKKLY